MAIDGPGGRGSRNIDPARRRQLAREVLAGYSHGADAPQRATALALERARGARAIILVEGISDQIALETLAVRQGRDLDADRVVVLPVGGAHGIASFLVRFGPAGKDAGLAGMCDAQEEVVLRRSLGEAGLGATTSRDAMQELGFFVCVDDLEDELIRAAGTEMLESLFDSQGDLGSFRTLQNQPAWRDAEVMAQMRRFLGSGSRRKLRYARLVVEALDVDSVPSPLVGVLAHV